MRILVEITHPAQVHLWRNAIGIWKARGHTVAVASRRKECLTGLLDEAGIEHVCLSRQAHGLLGLACELVVRYVRMIRLVGRFKPDVLVGECCISAGLAGRLTRRPVVVFENAEHAQLQQRLTTPFATVICTTTAYRKDWGKKHVRYEGIDNLAYTHPRYFRPDPNALSAAGLTAGQPYCILRLVSWRAAHDWNTSGISQQTAEDLIATLERHGRVLISSEGPLPAQWESYRIQAPPSAMLTLLSQAAIYVGEGASMAAEAACLGTPAVYINPLPLGYLRELQDRYGLVRCVTTATDAQAAIEEMLSQPRQMWSASRQRLLEEKVDVTQYAADFVEQVGSQASASSPPLLWKIVRWAVFAAVLAFVGKKLVVNFRDVAWSEINFHWGWLVLSAAFVAATKFMTVSNYRDLLAGFGHKTPPVAWAAVAWIPQLGKYVPGKVASVAGAAWLLEKFGVPMSVTTAIVFLLTGLATAVGIVLSLPLTLMEPLRHHLPLGWLWCSALLVAGVVCLHPRVFGAVVRTILGLLKRPMIPVPDTSHYLRPLASIFGQWILLGAAMWSVAGSLGHVSLLELPFYVSAQAISAALGFLAFVAPAGLGVREWILLLLLSPSLGPGHAAIVAVAWRLIVTLMDVVMAGAGMFLLRRHVAAKERAK